MGMSDDALSHAAHDAGTGRNGAVRIRMHIYVNTNVRSSMTNFCWPFVYCGFFLVLDVESET
jgi:hypothetical protein